MYKTIILLMSFISLCSVGCSQAGLSGEQASEIIIKCFEGKEVEILDNEDIERIDDILKYEEWNELEGTKLDFNPDLSIVEKYKSSQDKSRTIFFNKNSRNIKLVVDDKYTTFYEIDSQILDEVYDSLLNMLYDKYEDN